MPYTSSKLACMLGVSASTIQIMTRSGVLPYERDKKKNRRNIKKEDIAKFLVDNGHYYDRFYSINPPAKLVNAKSLIHEEISKIGTRSYSIGQIAELCDVCYKTAHVLFQRGKLKAHKSCGSLFSYENDILEMLQNDPLTRGHFLESTPADPIVIELKERMLKGLGL